MCHLRQNSVKFFEKYGVKKFAGILKPKIFKIPIAIEL